MVASLAWINPTSPVAGAALLTPLVLVVVIYRLGGVLQVPAASVPRSTS
jgi:hypothetical protein